MNREILFKAKRKDNGEWVEGCLIIDCVSGQYFIHQNGNSVNESPKIREEGCLRFFAFEIDPNTICQYTGLTDKNGRKIWENDIVSFLDTTSTENGYSECFCVGVISWDSTTASFQVSNRMMAESYEVLDEWGTIIGNIFDNADLLEVE